ncbi:hypothetical protein B4168_1716 [Anoxybacillus flavithermus]|nr:phage holin family protein [Parageobacillus thermoglucosidasius]KYD17316.1 hypothetical protein B4168_1716 [Anoxybacillus flavithermus]OAO84371.1 Holin toxin secretion/phage lysis [Parageobacillus thermoglucosidasius]
MERLDVAFKTGTATIGGMVVFFFGGWMIPLRILVSLSIVDYVSGLIAGAVEKNSVVK